MIESARLSQDGPLVSRLGYGAMVLEGVYGGIGDQPPSEVLEKAIEMDMMIDTADVYGNGHNETSIGHALKRTNRKAWVATKFGVVFDPDEKGSILQTGWGFPLKINGTPEYVVKALEASQQRLRRDTIDLWYAHYTDPNTPIEETVGAMAEAVKAGRVRYLGLSNPTAEDVRRAHAVHPIAAVQYEYSLWRREAEQELLPTLRELGIALVAWSPLGGGFLAGAVSSLSPSDLRSSNPKLQGENLTTNRDRYAPLYEIAKTLNITPAQLALSWLLHQGDDIFPIPGSRKTDRLDENARAVDIALDTEIIETINQVAALGAAQGGTLV